MSEDPYAVRCVGWAVVVAGFAIVGGVAYWHVVLHPEMTTAQVLRELWPLLLLGCVAVGAGWGMAHEDL